MTAPSDYSCKAWQSISSDVHGQTETLESAYSAQALAKLGLSALADNLWAWFIVQLGPAPIAAMSILAFGFFLFQAQAPCCAQTRRNEFCRNNASGILGGCHFKNHRWQNVRMLVDGATRQKAINGVLRGVDGKVATVAATISFCALLVSIGMLLVNMSKV